MSATVPTGLERCAVEECGEVLGRGAAARARRGSITCTLQTLDELAKVLYIYSDSPQDSLSLPVYSLQFDQLRSIDNYQAVVGTLPLFCQEEVYIYG